MTSDRSPEPDRPSDTESADRLWVRQPNGKTTPFDPGQLITSLYHARLEAMADHPDDTMAVDRTLGSAFVARELAEAVLHFLTGDPANIIWTTDEIADNVETVLRELGHARTAAAYARRRSEHEAIAHKDLASLEPLFPSEPRVLEAMPTQVGQGGSRALTIGKPAAASSRKPRRDGVTTPTEGETPSWSIDADWITAAWRSSGGAGLESAIGRRILSQFALHSVYSWDLVGLVEDGLLSLPYLDSPHRVLATTLEPAELARSAPDVAACFRRLEEAITTAPCASHVLIEDLDGVVGLLEPEGSGQRNWTHEFAQVLRRQATQGRPLLLSLSGRVRESIAFALSSGPLFEEAPCAAQEAAARRFALQLAELVAGDRQLAESCRIERCIHEEDPEFARWRELAAPRSGVILVRESAGSAVGPLVLDAIEVNLGLLARIQPVGEEALRRRVGILCESAVRAGVRKRDYLRRNPLADLPAKRLMKGTLFLVPIGLNTIEDEGARLTWLDALRESAERESRRQRLVAIVAADPYCLYRGSSGRAAMLHLPISSTMPALLASR